MTEIATPGWMNRFSLIMQGLADNVAPYRHHTGCPEEIGHIIGASAGGAAESQTSRERQPAFCNSATMAAASLKA